MRELELMNHKLYIRRVCCPQQAEGSEPEPECPHPSGGSPDRKAPPGGQNPVYIGTYLHLPLDLLPVSYKPSFYPTTKMHTDIATRVFIVGLKVTGKTTNEVVDLTG